MPYLRMTQASYVVNSILAPKVPFLCPKHIAICLTTGCIIALKFMLIPKLSIGVMTMSRFGPLFSMY